MFGVHTIHNCPSKKELVKLSNELFNIDKKLFSANHNLKN